MNEEQVALLKSGAEAWNAWRQRTPGVFVNLRGANLSGRHLMGADLTDADLSGANMTFANLWGARLVGAKLVDVQLQDADLRNARLSRANLSGANLTGTNLTGADLTSSVMTEAVFAGTVLDQARLHDAMMGNTVLANVNLRDALGLVEVRHAGPSTIGLDSLYLSAGRIEERFLRGCGVPDELIGRMPGLIGAEEAVRFYSCFISYSTQDEAFAKRLHSRLREEHVRVWFAPEDMKGGEKIDLQIDAAIDQHERLLLVLSAQSLESKWVMTEVRRARRQEQRDSRRKLFPISLIPFDSLNRWSRVEADGTDLIEELRSYFIPDFSNWKDDKAFEPAIARLLRDLRAAEG